MFKIDSLMKDFKDVADWMAFAESQQKLIAELNQKNNQMAEEVEHLKGLLGSTVPMLITDRPTDESISVTDDAETICRMEIAKLRDISSRAALTMEEAKRFEIFSKQLQTLQSKAAPREVKARNVSDKDLLLLAEGKDE